MRGDPAAVGRCACWSTPARDVVPQPRDLEEHFEHPGNGALINHAIWLSGKSLSLRLTDEPDCAALCVARTCRFQAASL
jgi:hypothetical protein